MTQTPVNPTPPGPAQPNPPSPQPTSPDVTQPSETPTGVTPGPTPVPAPEALVTLPPAPVEANVPQPAGAPGGLRVLDWGGFSSAISYTFDDANSTQIANYDALNALGVRMTFYIQTNKREASDPIWAKAVEDGHELGNHTHSHQEDDDGTDVDRATEFIQTTFGVTPYTMAAPFGKDVYAGLAESRFLINRGVSNGLVGPGDNTNPFKLPCFIPAEGAPAGDFNSQADSARAANKWRTVLVHGFTGGTDGAYQPVELEQFVAAVEYAKGLNDVWIDSVVNIGAYWLGQKAFNAATPVADGANQVWSWTLPENFPPGHILRVTVDGGTLSQNGESLVWDSHGYYEISLDAKSLTLSP
jgi:peptidoglycan/xylan/chitin deacetylase (PgdA/CDA1 family)